MIVKLRNEGFLEAKHARNDEVVSMNIQSQCI